MSTKGLRWLAASAALAGAVGLAGASSASAALDLCLATGGNVWTWGNAYCDANGAGSTAIAYGDGASAGAIEGTGNLAVAIGDDASAAASVGNGNRAISVGGAADALAANGNANLAIAFGAGAQASAAGNIVIGASSANTAIAGPGCRANAPNPSQTVKTVIAAGGVVLPPGGTGSCS